MTLAIASTVGTTVIVSIAAFSAGCEWSKTRGVGPDGELASDAGIETICKGSGLFEDSSGLPGCPSPGAPIHDCALGVAKVSRFTSLPSTSTFEAETMTVDPRPDSSLAYAATIESIVAPGPGPTGTCVTHKQIHVYRSPDLGLTWSGSTITRHASTPGSCRRVRVGAQCARAVCRPNEEAVRQAARPRHRDRVVAVR
jgi:hypothetical protein